MFNSEKPSFLTRFQDFSKLALLQFLRTSSTTRKNFQVSIMWWELILYEIEMSAHISNFMKCLSTFAQKYLANQIKRSQMFDVWFWNAMISKWLLRMLLALWESRTLCLHNVYAYLGKLQKNSRVPWTECQSAKLFLSWNIFKTSICVRFLKKIYQQSSGNI